jgi:hypothetical protein
MFTQLAFDLIAGSDADIRERVNEHAGFWNGVLGGLQTAAFVALGRIFDTRKDTNNAGRLQLYAVDHPGIFSESSLAARKVAQGLNPTFAAQYASEAHHLKKGDLQPLVDALDEQRAYYDDAVAPIRHNVFAHQGRMTRAERDEIFEQLPIRQLGSAESKQQRLRRRSRPERGHRRPLLAPLTPVRENPFDQLRLLDARDHL